jgi:hypothetical protein
MFVCDLCIFGFGELLMLTDIFICRMRFVFED